MYSLEMLGKRNRDMKEIQKHWIVPGRQPSENWICLCLLLGYMLIYPNPKEGVRRQKTALVCHKGQTEQWLASIAKTSSHYFLF